MQQLICDKCRGANCYITGENLATCRSCGNSYAFTYDKCLSTEEIVASLKTATNNNSAYLKELANSFFYHSQKPAWKKHSIYYNMLVFLEYGQCFLKGAIPVMTLPAAKLDAMLAGKIRLHTRQVKTSYSGLVLLHRESTSVEPGQILAAAFLKHCSFIIAAGLKAYADEVAQGLKINAPSEGLELTHSDFTPRRYAYQLQEFKTLLAPLNYPNAINGFSPFIGDQKTIKINWNENL
jgi:hypothetical protein